MTEPLEAPKRLKKEPKNHGWRGADLSEDDYVDDDWIRQNTKEVKADGLDESDSS